MYHAFIWLLCIEAIGLITLPIVFTVFRRLPNRGVTLAKPLGLLLATYVLWLGALTPIISNSRGVILVVLFGLAAISVFLLRKHARELTQFLYRERHSLLIGELIFLAFYALWLGIVSQAPAINHTEKPMDFAFLNAILQAAHFPPEDPWLSGHPISYYYMGHMMMAFLAKLSGISSNISYNLAVALIPALVGAGAFGLVYNLIRLSGAQIRSAIAYAMAAPLLLALVGNLEGVLEFVYARGWGSEGFWQWVSIKDLGGPVNTAGWFSSDPFWWFHGTRVIDTVVDGRSLDYTITEFPFFSFLLGDLHAHVLALPFMLLVIALILNMFMTKGSLGLGWLLRHLGETLLITVSLGALAFINLADFPVFAALFVAVVFVMSYRQGEGRILRATGNTLAFGLPVVAAAFLMFLPFHMGFNTQVSGVLPLREVSTRPLFFVLIWGLFLMLSLPFLVGRLRGIDFVRSRAFWGLLAAVTLSPFVAWAGLELYPSIVEEGVFGGLVLVGARLGKLLPLLVIIAASVYAILARAKGHGNHPFMFPLILLGLAFYLLMGVELFRLVDFFGDRRNTVFKVYYQAWLLLSIVSAYGLYYWHSRAIGWPSTKRLGQALRYGWIGVVVVLLAASLYYPLGAVLDRTGNFSRSPSLDGLAFLETSAPQEYEAIRWLRDKAPRGRIVEALGDDYSEYGRISASTGLPTILGWRFHELQWRGSTRPYDGREGDIAQIYTSNDPARVAQLLEKHGIRYVYVGNRELTTYGDIQLDRFDSILRPVFVKNDVVVYESRLKEADIQ